MDSKEEALVQYEKQDSIEISKSVNGKYGWKIKRYYNYEKQSPIEVMEQINNIDMKLQSVCDRVVEVE